MENNDVQCSSMIIANLWWNSSKLEQVIARTYRPPQKSHVDVYIPRTADTIELSIIEQKSNQALIASSIAYKDVLLGKYHSQLEYTRLLERESNRLKSFANNNYATRSMTTALDYLPPSGFQRRRVSVDARVRVGVHVLLRVRVRSAAALTDCPRCTLPTWRRRERTRRARFDRTPRAGRQATHQTGGGEGPPRAENAFAGTLGHSAERLETGRERLRVTFTIQRNNRNPISHILLCREHNLGRDLG